MADTKVALITGASRGIGQAIMLRLAESGFVVVGTATGEKGRDSINECLKKNNINNYLSTILDVNCEESVKACFAEIKSSVGLPSVLVNNAAITKDNIFLRMKEDEWSQVIDTNLNAVFRLTKRALKPMFRARWGRVINISSVVASMGNVGQCNYAASKAGVVAMSKSLAREVASFGVTVNCVSPGFVDTDMAQAVDEKVKEAMLNLIPMKRMAEPREIADAVAFLASDQSSYITGEKKNINGGMLMC